MRLVLSRLLGYDPTMSRKLCTLPLLLVVAIAGCDAAIEQFPPNKVHALVVATSRQVPTDPAAKDATELVDTWFGTPEQPLWPADLLESSAARTLVDPERLARAAGPVYSDQDNRHFGLFNEHCVTCHGVSGGGNGPASLLQNPYPRDFRPGVYKWKSTRLAAKPTRRDLMQILQHGAPGSGMPAFSLIEEEDLEALIDYVIFLSVRGEFERQMISGAVDELGYEDDRPEADLNLQSVAKDQTLALEASEFAVEVLNDVANEWVSADQDVVSVPEETSLTAESVERGRELFHGPIANCSGCHGQNGNAEAVTVDFDDWTKEFTTRLSITPSDRDAVKPFRKAGALRPRQIYPRKLSSGVFRGGGDGETLYRRLVVGIAGTPMPAVPVAENATATTLSADQVWDLVHYVQSLGGAE